MPRTNKILREKTIFRCDDHCGKITQKLLSFYEDYEFFDTVIIAGSNSINIGAHSIILSAMSEYFLDKFRGGSQSPSKPNVIEIKEIQAPALKSIVDYMYSGWIELNLENAEGVLRTASFLKMQDLVDGCSEFIADHITYFNCLSWLQFANDMNLSELKEKSLNITFKHLEQVAKGKELVHLNETELINLLFGENPYGHYQEYVFLSLVAWIDYDKANRQNLSFKLISQIHFKYLTPKLIIENRKSICKSVECYELVCSWLQWHLSPETRTIKQESCKLAVVADIDCEELSIQSYQPRLDSWSVEIQKTHFKNKPGCSKIVIDGKLIIVGGLIDNEQKCSVDCLFLNTFKWNRIPPMQHERIDSQLANLDGHLCVFGGRVSNHFLMNSIEIYNFHKRQWSNVTPVYKPSEYSKIVTHNGILYIVDFEYGRLQSYHLSSNVWSSKVIPQEKLINFDCAAVGRFLFIIGGYSFGEKKLVSRVKRYTISNDTWCEVAPLPQDSVLPVKAAIIENRIVVCGGAEFYGDLIAEYDPETIAWKILSKLVKETPCYNSIICTLPVF